MKSSRTLLSLSFAILTATLLFACKKDAASPASLFPQGAEVPNWNKAAETRTYAPAELSNYIDGDAEQYLKAGVQSTSTSDYKSSDQVQAVVDIYTMSSPAGAQTIFESDPAANATTPPIGDAARLHKQSLLFRRGPYLVRIVAYSVTPQLETEFLELGKAIDKKLSH